MNHSLNLHLRDDLDEPTRHFVATRAHRALYSVERCECGSEILVPYDQSFIDLMREEWRIRLEANEQITRCLMVLVYDPVVRDDLACREVWA